MMRFFSGDSAIASGIEPRSYETPAGSSWAPVGSRRGPDGLCATIAAGTCEEGALQAAAKKAARIKSACDGFAPRRVGKAKRGCDSVMPQKMALTPDSASLIFRE